MLVNVESGLFRNLTHQAMFEHGVKVNLVFSLNAVIKMVNSMEITALRTQQMKELVNKGINRCSIIELFSKVTFEGCFDYKHPPPTLCQTKIISKNIFVEHNF